MLMWPTCVLVPRHSFGKLAIVISGKPAADPFAATSPTRRIRARTHTRSHSSSALVCGRPFPEYFLADSPVPTSLDRSPSLSRTSRAIPKCEQPLALLFLSSGAARSEEHTSELQSLAYLVCR